MGSDAELRWIAEATGATRVERGATIQSLWRGYGEIHRVRIDGRSAVVKSVRPPARGEDASHRRKCTSYDVELAWYRDWASLSRARVPSMLAGAASGERWLFVLEDLDAVGFGGRRRRDPTFEDVERCLAWLAAFHACFLDRDPAGLWRRGTYWDVEKRTDELRAIDDPAVREAAPLLDRRLREARFQTIVHGDAKLANFCFGADGVAAVDFQWVGRGSGVSDVAYLVSSCWDDEPALDEARLLDVYFAHLSRELRGRTADVAAIEAEWRALYPIAAADFSRFLAGWAKEHWRLERRAQRVLRDALRAL